MTAEEYLEQWRMIDGRIERLLGELASLQAVAERMTTVLRPDRGSGTGDPHSGETAIAALADARTEIDVELARLIALKLEIPRTVRAVGDPMLRRVLERRYLDGMDWPAIAEELSFGVDNVYKLHRKALEVVRVPDGGRSGASGREKGPVGRVRIAKEGAL